MLDGLLSSTHQSEGKGKDSPPPSWTVTRMCSVTYHLIGLLFSSLPENYILSFLKTVHNFVEEWRPLLWDSS